MAATNYYSVVQQLYISYFGRPADPQGQQNFAGQLAALDPSGTLTNTTALNTYVQAHPASAIATLVGSFNAQPESVALYGSGTTTVEIARFVSAIYNNVLHRDPDIDGANFWIAQIVSGGLSKANAALAITEGALANTSAQGRIDAAQVDHTLAIGADFTAALDTVTKVNAYAGDAAATQARDLLRAVTPRTETVEFHG